MIIPTGDDDPRMSTAKRQTLADFMYYSLCAGQTKAGPYGYSPLPLNLVQAGFQQIAKLKAADPDVDLTDRDVRSCNNPTFDGKNLNSNVLAEIAPQPAACDKVGAGPCGTDTGTNKPTTDDARRRRRRPAAVATATGGGGGGGGGGWRAGATRHRSIDPETGEVVGDDGHDARPGEAIYANPTELAADRAVDQRTFGWLAVARAARPGAAPRAVRRARSAAARRQRVGGRRDEAASCAPASLLAAVARRARRRDRGADRRCPTGSSGARPPTAGARPRRSPASSSRPTGRRTRSRATR